MRFLKENAMSIRPCLGGFIRFLEAELPPARE